jgi:hypothetical protein
MVYQENVDSGGSNFQLDSRSSGYQDGTVALTDGVDWIVPIVVREQFVDC